MQETTQRIIKLLGLLLPDLLVKKCSCQTSLQVLSNQIDCKAGTTAKGQNLLANKYWPWGRLALLGEILANKFCPFAVVPALQSIWKELLYTLKAFARLCRTLRRRQFRTKYCGKEFYWDPLSSFVNLYSRKTRYRRFYLLCGKLQSGN